MTDGAAEFAVVDASEFPYLQHVHPGIAVVLTLPDPREARWFVRRRAIDLATRIDAFFATRKNDGSLLSVAALAPDLVLDMGGGGRDTMRIAQRLGMRLLTLPYPQSLGDVEQSVRAVAAALGRPAAGEQVVAGIERLKRTAPPPRIDTMWLGGGGRSVAPDGLAAQWMALAGLKQRALHGDPG